MPSNDWYVITGGPSTGKTTLLAELEKLGYQTIPEAARTLIDEAATRGIPATTLRADEKKFQEDVTRLKEKIETEHDKHTLTFFDRGMHDTIAYLRHYGFQIEDWIKKLVDRSSYQKVFLLEPLADYHHDYARTEDEGFRERIEQLLHDAYAEYGMEPVHVPAVSPSERATFILDQVNMR